MAQDPWWPAPEPSPDPRTVYSWELPNTVLYTADAPGPSPACVRVSWQSTLQGVPPLQRVLRVEFAQFPICTAAEWEQARQDVLSGQSERYWKLKMPLQTVSVEMRVGREPPPSQELQRALRALEKRRFNAKKALPIPNDDGKPGLWRTLYIEPDKQTDDDVRFLLALVLLQESMVPEAEVEPVNNAMVDYLHEAMHLTLVLHGLSWTDCYAPSRSHKPGPPCSTISSSLWHGRRSARRGVFSLSAVRLRQRAPVMSLWTMPWPDLSLSACPPLGRRYPVGHCRGHWWDHAWLFMIRLGGLWVTWDGLTEARKQLMPKAATQSQIALGKEKEAARKFTHRHKRNIQEAASRGDTLKAIVEALGITAAIPAGQ